MAVDKLPDALARFESNSRLNILKVVLDIIMMSDS
ncbi:hypothetical protein MGSAQ_001954 [marine sediment metagenome]|uniref:Uncharacterized protein n=1 Tax=marine sediment metagenome TaxID=412755 RepID=A0A1B6NSU0_9ZZZZ